MGLFQKAVETYEHHITYATEKGESSTMMAPIGHIVTRADLEIVINEEGHFVNASAVDKNEPKIIIPATESSSGRTSAPSAHPLCDQIGYLVPYNEIKYRLYTDQLEDWCRSEYTHPKPEAVLRYVRGGTLITDLQRSKVIKVKADGRPDDEKLLVRWRVLGTDEEACWLDRTLFNAFTQYYMSRQTGKKSLCMVTGETTIIASQHPKGVVAMNGNAKLISANDSQNFTYRGRFSDDWQAAEVGYEASQKAHSALRWLVQEQGVIFGERTFLCWNPEGRTIIPPTFPFLKAAEPIFRPSDYKEELKKKLNGRKAELKLTDGVVIAAFDAATTGRLSVTYYNELQGHDFLERLYDWDESCCWCDPWYGIQSPTLKQIVDCAFGVQRSEKGEAKLETDARIMRQLMQRLIVCRLERTMIGKDIVKALVDRASRPIVYEKNVYRRILFTACAVIRKYRYDMFKEEWKMALEPERKDRSYQFGRLLAVMEKIERDTYAGEDSRETNAIRMQSVFCQRPMYAAGNLEKQLERAYFPRLKPGSRVWYKNLMGEIMEIISAFPEEDWNKALDDTYLMGYYLQRNALYARRDNEENGGNENA